MTLRREAHERLVGTVDVEELSDTVAAVNLEGDCDMATAPSLEGHVMRLLGNGTHVIINLSDATFIDSSIVRALFNADAAARKNGHLVALQIGTAAAVERVLELTCADKHLPVAKTRTQALALLESAPSPRVDVRPLPARTSVSRGGGHQAGSLAGASAELPL
jgi:anti-sigma B factor antagonist